MWMIQIWIDIDMIYLKGTFISAMLFVVQYNNIQTAIVICWYICCNNCNEYFVLNWLLHFDVFIQLSMSCIAFPITITTKYGRLGMRRGHK